MTGHEALAQKLEHYGSSHRNSTNQKIHKICVPAIMLSVLGLLAAIPGPLNWALIFTAASFIYYARFQSKMIYLSILLQLVPMGILIYLMGPYKFEISLAIFVFAWIGQFIGHKIEGHKPSFFEDIQYLWIGPLWVLQGVIKYV